MTLFFILFFLIAVSTLTVVIRYFQPERRRDLPHRILWSIFVTEVIYFVVVAIFFTWVLVAIAFNLVTLGILLVVLLAIFMVFKNALMPRRSSKK